jgi:phage repressor protein C with HTH and peptisase S24 domain
MEPRFFQGETLFVNPHHPCQPGDFVVVEIGGHQGMVKRLVRRTSEYVELEQYNPPETKKFKRTEIRAICKVVGSKAR